MSRKSMDILTESQKAAETLFYRVARKTLLATSTALLREFVSSQIKEKRKVANESTSTASVEIPSVSICQSDLNNIYETTAQIGLAWIEELKQGSDDQNGVLDTYINAIQMAVEKRMFSSTALGDNTDENKQDLDTPDKTSNVHIAESESDISSNTSLSNAQLRIKYKDPCCLLGHLSDLNDDDQLSCFGKPAPNMTFPYTKDTKVNKDHYSQWIKFQIQKLDDEARQGNTSWYGKGMHGWSAVDEECSRVITRAHDFSSFMKQKEELEIIPKGLVTVELPENDSQRELEQNLTSLPESQQTMTDDSGVPLWKSSMFTPGIKRELKRKRKREGQQVSNVDFTLDRKKYSLPTGRIPSSLGEVRWSMNDIKEDVEKQFDPIETRLLSNAFHNLDEVQTSSIHLIQGAAKRVGEIHIWEQDRDIDEELHESVTSKVIRERVRSGKIPSTFSCSKQMPSRLLRSEIDGKEIFEIDMGSCLVELVDDVNVKHLHAFRSLELSLDMKSAVEDKMNHLVINAPIEFTNQSAAPV